MTNLATATATSHGILSFASITSCTPVLYSQNGEWFSASKPASAIEKASAEAAIANNTLSLVK